MNRIDQKKIVAAVAVMATFWVAHRAYGSQGLALVAGGLLFWVLLHFTRVMGVLRRAADRPKGWVGSAVMLHSKVAPGMNMLQLVGLAGAIGQELQAVNDVGRESWVWADDGGSRVTVTLDSGKVTSAELLRHPSTPNS